MRIAELGGVPIPILALLPSGQTFDPMTRETIHPMGDGSSEKQVLAGSVGKLRTTIRGEGPIPPGLDGLDFTGPLLLKSGAGREITSTSNVITIPSARRGDAGYVPWGRAFVNDKPISTPVAMSVDEATLTIVTGASAYQVLWYPQFNVLVEGGLRKTEDLTGATVRWSLNMRQN